MLCHVGGKQSVRWPLEAQPTEASLLVSMPLSKGWEKGRQNRNTPPRHCFTAAVTQGISQPPSWQRFCCWSLKSHQSRRQHHCTSASSAVTAPHSSEGKELELCKLITIDHWFPPAEWVFTFCVSLKTNGITPFCSWWDLKAQIWLSRSQPHCSLQRTAPAQHHKPRTMLSAPKSFHWARQNHARTLPPFDRTTVCPNSMAHPVVMQTDMQVKHATSGDALKNLCTPNVH